MHARRYLAPVRGFSGVPATAAHFVLVALQTPSARLSGSCDRPADTWQTSGSKQLILRRRLFLKIAHVMGCCVRMRGVFHHAVDFLFQLQLFVSFFRFTRDDKLPILMALPTSFCICTSRLHFHSRSAHHPHHSRLQPPCCNFNMLLTYHLPDHMQILRENTVQRAI